MPEIKKNIVFPLHINMGRGGIINIQQELESIIDIYNIQSTLEKQGDDLYTDVVSNHDPDNDMWWYTIYLDVTVDDGLGGASVGRVPFWYVWDSQVDDFYLASSEGFVFDKQDEQEVIEEIVYEIEERYDEYGDDEQDDY